MIPERELVAARAALAGSASAGVGAAIARASQPIGHLTDAAGAVPARPRFSPDEAAFRAAVPAALPGIAGEATAGLWGAVAAAPRLQRAFEVVLTRALDPLDGLGTYPPAAVFSQAELADLRALEQDAREPRPPGRGAVTGILKVTRLCNLRCSYCHDWREGRDATMPFGVRARAVRWLVAQSGAGAVNFLLHGGEPSLLGVRGLLKMLALQAHWRRPGQRIATLMQTNGARLSPQLVQLMALFDIRVSVSLDGPPEVHDVTRRDTKGRATSDAVRQTLRSLRSAGVLNGVLVVVTPALVAAGARRLVDFLLSEGLGEVGLLPMRPAAGAAPAPADSLPTAAFCRFLLEVEAERRARAPDLRIRELDAMQAALARAAPQTCELQGHCVGSYFAIEPDGSVSHCDKFLGDGEYVLGTVTDRFADVADGPAARALRARAAAAKAAKGACAWWDRCRGWCPHEDYVARRLGSDAGCCGLAPAFEGLRAMEAARGRELATA